MGRQDDPQKVSFPIGFGRFVHFNLNSFLDRFGNRFIIVTKPKTARKLEPRSTEGRRWLRKNNTLRIKRPERYVNKGKRTKGTLIRNSFPFFAKGYINKDQKTMKNLFKMNIVIFFLGRVRR